MFHGKTPATDVLISSATCGYPVEPEDNLWGEAVSFQFTVSICGKPVDTVDNVPTHPLHFLERSTSYKDFPKARRNIHPVVNSGEAL